MCTHISAAPALIAQALGALETLATTVSQTTAYLDQTLRQETIERTRLRWLEALGQALDLSRTTGDAGLLSRCVASANLFLSLFASGTHAVDLVSAILDAAHLSPAPHEALESVRAVRVDGFPPQLEVARRAVLALLEARATEAAGAPVDPNPLRQALAGPQSLPPPLEVELRLRLWQALAAQDDLQAEREVLAGFYRLLRHLNGRVGDLARAVENGRADMALEGEAGRNLVLQAALRLAALELMAEEEEAADEVLRDLIETGWGELMVTSSLSVRDLAHLCGFCREVPEDRRLLVVEASHRYGIASRDSIDESLHSALYLNAFGPVAVDPDIPVRVDERFESRSCLPELHEDFAELLRETANTGPWAGLRPLVRPVHALETGSPRPFQGCTIEFERERGGLDGVFFLAIVVPVGMVFEVALRPLISVRREDSGARARALLLRDLAMRPGYRSLTDAATGLVIETACRLQSRMSARPGEVPHAVPC